MPTFASGAGARGGGSGGPARAGSRSRGWLPLRARRLPEGDAQPVCSPAARSRGGRARRSRADEGTGQRGWTHPTRARISRAHVGSGPEPRTLRPGRSGHRPGAGPRLLPLRRRSGARRRRRLLGRGLLRPLARAGQRRPFHARARLLAGVLAPSGKRGSPRVFVSHGTRDRWLPIDSCSRRIVPRLERAGYEVRYREFGGGHVVPPAVAREAASWFADRG